MISGMGVRGGKASVAAIRFTSWCSSAGAEGESVEVFAESVCEPQELVAQEVKHVLDPFQDRLNDGASELTGAMRAVHGWYFLLELV